MNTLQKGFTLIELMITVLVLSILATLAYPSYHTYIRQTRLNSVRSELVQNAKNLERFYAQNHTFVGYNPAHLSQNQYFDISFATDSTSNSTDLSDAGFTLQATPNTGTNADEPCTVYLNDSGLFWSESKDAGQSCFGYESLSNQ